jgi:hypothetical protein
MVGKSEKSVCAVTCLTCGAQLRLSRGVPDALAAERLVHEGLDRRAGRRREERAVDLDHLGDARRQQGLVVERVVDAEEPSLWS